MSGNDTVTIQVQTHPAEKAIFEREAANLNLTPSAYFLYLLSRGQMSSSDAQRFERGVKAVFGKHGELMRRLAK